MRWALSAGIKPGDRVCLIMPTQPDYVAAWLGISRIGGVLSGDIGNGAGQTFGIRAVNEAGLKIRKMQVNAQFQELSFRFVDNTGKITCVGCDCSSAPGAADISRSTSPRCGSSPCGKT